MNEAILARHRPLGESKRTNITVEAALLVRARALGVNISAVSEVALREAVREAAAAAWRAENAETLELRRAELERSGLPLARHAVWRPE